MEAALSWLVPAFDVALALALVSFAAAMLLAPDPFQAIVVFIIFGLLMAITWGRLGAVDIALAEAAIGAGITGALLLNAHGDVVASAGQQRAARAGDAAARERRPLPVHALAWLLLLPVAAALILAVVAAPAELPGVRPWVLAALAQSGADNPVTAVLLNFRAHDTLLELVVLVLAVAGAWAQRLRPPALDTPPPGPVLLAAVRLLVPGIVLIGGYLLWRGTHAPGGAFQAGAVLAGAGVLLLLAERPLPARLGGWPVRLLLSIGVLLFALVGVGSMLAGQRFLFYRGDQAAAWIVVIEAAATVSIAVSLAALFAGQPPATAHREGA